MSRLFSFLVLLILVVAGLAFAVVNDQPVSLNYFLGVIDVPLALTLVLTLALGAALGILFSMGMIVRLKRDGLKLRRQAQLAEQEVANLRSIPIKDSH